jgi:ABC-type nitrate/sulfonate/bicarbonate transport system substrate-binding protein
MAEACDVHKNTFEFWAEAHPEFLEAFTRAKQKAQAWFEVEGRTGMTADRFNSALWAKQMSARHRAEYTERREHTGANGGAIKTEETGAAAAKLATLLSGYAERSGTPGEPAGE